MLERNETLHFDTHDLEFLSFIHPIHPDTAPSYTPEQRIFFPRLLKAVDARMGQLADLTPGNPLVYRANTTQEAREYMNNTVQAVAILLKNDPDIVCIPLLFGTTGMIQKLEGWFAGTATARQIVPFVAERSSGTALDTAHVVGSIDQDLLNNSRFIIILDDVLDHGGALAAVASYLMELRTNAVVRQEQEKIVEHVLQNKKTPFEKLVPLYRTLVGELQKNNILVAFPFSKNRPLLSVLRGAAVEDPTLWGSLQQTLLWDIRQFEVHDWIMGEHIDTGVQWVDIAREIDSQWPWLLNDPTVTPLVTGLESALVRVGNGVDGIVALQQDNGEGTQFARLLRWEAEQIRLQIRSHTLNVERTCHIAKIQKE